MQDECKTLLLCEECIKSLSLCKPFNCYSPPPQGFCEECSYLKQVWRVKDEKIIEGCYYNGFPCNDLY